MVVNLIVSVVVLVIAPITVGYLKGRKHYDPDTYKGRIYYAWPENMR